MKVLPAKPVTKKITHEDKELTTSERVTKVMALIIAFVTVYFFFFKILFF